MQVSTHDLITPAANKQHKINIEDQLPEYFNHGRILAPLAYILFIYCKGKYSRGFGDFFSNSRVFPHKNISLPHRIFAKASR